MISGYMLLTAVCYCFVNIKSHTRSSMHKVKHFGTCPCKGAKAH